MRGWRDVRTGEGQAGDGGAAPAGEGPGSGAVCSGEETVRSSAELAGGGQRRAAARRRFLRLAVYAAPAAVAVDLARAARALALSAGGQGVLEWPDNEEYGGPFPTP